MTKTAVLFPGQGSQERGMGRDAAEASSEAMDLWVLAEKESGLALREIYWHGEDRDLAETRALQPALTAVNLSLWLGLRDRLRPWAAAGHSLGEFSALAAAGVLSLKDAVRATALRGRLMAEAGHEGQGMAAVLKLPRQAVEDIVARAAEQTGKGLLLANYNSPAQFVISGEKAALDAAAAMAKEQKGRAVALSVSGAFHSPLISEAAAEFAAFLNRLDWREPRFRVYLNATARSVADPAGILETMAGQMTSPVRWIQTVAALWDAGCREFVEIGPKTVLSKLIKANLGDKAEDWTSLSASGPGRPTPVS
ncbi:MAG: ACP S-malonyltransferase [Desulfovibrionaceae bacterium]|nr:ACP S-malonyltransferase [Desulfovibrionaceae bacterium]MDD4951994.1 ACP S-malonyltransferase [Desulfovibrionaceae bacterium]